MSGDDCRNKCVFRFRRNTVNDGADVMPDDDDDDDDDDDYDHNEHTTILCHVLQSKAPNSARLSNIMNKRNWLSNLRRCIKALGCTDGLTDGLTNVTQYAMRNRACSIWVMFCVQRRRRLCFVERGVDSSATSP